MEFEDYNLNDSERTAVVISFRKPFLDWIYAVGAWSTMTEEEEQEAVRDCTTVILLPEMESTFEIEDYLKKHYERIFYYLLNEKNDDQDLWPQQRSYTMFREWFDVNEIDWVLDMDTLENIKLKEQPSVN
jgi:hypothetical protein